MRLSHATAAAMGLVEEVSAERSAKIKADKQHGSSLCKWLVEAVRIITGIEGVLEYEFVERRRFRFDCAWPEHKIAVELNGWQHHHRRGAMERDNLKLSMAVLRGWRVFYCTAGQMNSAAPIWVAEALRYGKDSADEDQETTEEVPGPIMP